MPEPSRPAPRDRPPRLRRVLRDGRAAAPPELAGQPVIVAGSGPRAVVTTASYEARKFGVGSAMPASRARRLCPHAVVIPPDFAAYREKSQAVWALVAERLRARCSTSRLDEAYADITAFEKPLRVLRDLVAEVREQTGITISVGVGPSRLVAKTAQRRREARAGFVVLIARGRGRPLRRARRRGCCRASGRSTPERLAEMGITTIAHLQAAPRRARRRASARAWAAG